MEAILYQLVKATGGHVGAVADSAASDSLQSKFLVSSLIMEEAITSAQLEGASTTREVAKKMLEEEVFYWFMLKSEYRLFKYISISKLLKENPKDYGLSYMYTEKDNNDLTYFIYFQLDTISKAFEELTNYLNNKVSEFKEISESLEKTVWGNALNFIQKDLIKKALKEPGRIFSIKEVSNSYSITDNTSRAYLNKLTELKLFLSTKDGRKTIYIAPSDLLKKLNSAKT